MSGAPEPLVWTVAEVARLLRVSRDTVRALIADGRLDAITIGRRILIPKVALDRFMAGANTQDAA